MITNRLAWYFEDWPWQSMVSVGVQWTWLKNTKHHIYSGNFKLPGIEYDHGAVIRSWWDVVSDIQIKAPIEYYQQNIMIHVPVLQISGYHGLWLQGHHTQCVVSLVWQNVHIDQPMLCIYLFSFVYQHSSDMSGTYRTFYMQRFIFEVSNITDVWLLGQKWFGVNMMKNFLIFLIENWGMLIW